MEGGGGSYRVRTAEDLFRDYKGRRSAMIKALTDDFGAFYLVCDPEKENMCLYGFPDETWQVTLPAEEVPTELPEPVLGINFARDAMDRKEWLTMVATYSDSWLLSVAFYFAARFGFDKQGRKELFTLINSVPTVYEVVRRNFPKQRAPNSSSRSNTSNSKVQQPEPRGPKNDFSKQEDSGVENEEDEDDEHEDTLCGACEQNYSDDPFWICCDLCEQWYHGKCVKITPARAEHIKQYKCPACSGQKRG